MQLCHWHHFSNPLLLKSCLLHFCVSPQFIVAAHFFLLVFVPSRVLCCPCFLPLPSSVFVHEVFECSCIVCSIDPATKCLSPQFFLCLWILAFLQLVVASIVLFSSSSPYAIFSVICKLIMLAVYFVFTQSLLPMLPWRSCNWIALAERLSDCLDGWVVVKSIQCLEWFFTSHKAVLTTLLSL